MKHLIALTACLFSLMTFSAHADQFPNLELKGQLTPQQQAYLGVQGNTFKISDIAANYLFVEAFSMYCPICQREAPAINELYDTVSQLDNGHTIRFIGVATGNSAYETAFFQKKYSIEFPLFEDVDYVAHSALGEIGTPTFYIVHNTPNGLKTLFMHEGEIKDTNRLLEAIHKATGM